MLSLPVPREPRLLVVLLLASVIGLPALRAQDVTVGDPAQPLPDAAPEVLPVPKSSLKPDNPGELHNTVEIRAEKEVPPKAIYQVKPEYPDAMGESQVGGMVEVSFVVDTSGRVLNPRIITSDNPAFDNAALEAVMKWRFEPAMRDGEKIAAQCRQTMKFEAPGGVIQLPKVISQAPPEFPVAMEQYGLEGQVTLEFNVDTEGRPKNAVIVASDNPAFDEPALDALWKWRFEPAMRDGKKIVSSARQTIDFRLLGGDGRSAFEINVRAKQSKLPPELRYDVPPKILGVRIPVYPYAQRREDVRGKAVATMLIDPQGAVAAVKVQSADQPEFGLALAAALENFTFDPALKDGKPVPHLLSFEQKFDSIELPDREASWLLGVEKKHPEKIVRAATLDAPIKLRSRKEPHFPKSVGEKVTTGDALIECLIDENGRVRLPRIVKASEPAFGYAAVQAIAAWWFEPPRQAGKPVVTRVQVPFIFGH